MSLVLYIGVLFLTILLLKVYSSYQTNNDVLLCEQEKWFSIDNHRINIDINMMFWGVIAFIPLWIVIAFRDYTVGTDSRGIYKNLFKYAVSGIEWDPNKSEFSYYWLNRFVASFTDSYHIFIIITGSISWILFYKYIIKNSYNPALSIAIFFLNFYYFHQFNAIRQCLACAIALYGFKYIYERHLIKYVLVIIFAATIHTMVLMLLPLYFLYEIRADLKRSLIVIIGSKLMFSWFWGYLPRLLRGTKYYIQLFMSNGFAGGFYWSEFFVSLVIFIVVYYIKYVTQDDNQETNMNLWLQTIVMCILVNSNSIPTPLRFLWYFDLNTMVFVPNMLMKIESSRNKQILSFIICMIYCVYFCQQWFVGSDGIQEYLLWRG